MYQVPKPHVQVQSTQASSTSTSTGTSNLYSSTSKSTKYYMSVMKRNNHKYVKFQSLKETWIAESTGFLKI